MIQTPQERRAAERKRAAVLAAQIAARPQETQEFEEQEARVSERYQQVKSLREQQAQDYRRAMEKFDKTKYEGVAPSERLKVLQEFASFVLSVISYDEVKRRRRAFDSAKGKFSLDGEMCWVCRKNPAAHRHHVIQIQHGGRPTASRNLVNLCEMCHTDIHPWMDKPALPVSAARFEVEKAKSDAARLLELVATNQRSCEAVEVQLRDICRRVFSILRD